MEFGEMLEKIAQKYLERDKKSGKLFLLSVLVEEVGELSEAIRKGEVEAIEEELADVAFMVFCMANLFGVNIENRLVEKYLVGDPSYKWDLP